MRCCAWFVNGGVVGCGRRNCQAQKGTPTSYTAIDTTSNRSIDHMGFAIQDLGRRGGSRAAQDQPPLILLGREECINQDTHKHFFSAGVASVNAFTRPSSSTFASRLFFFVRMLSGTKHRPALPFQSNRHIENSTDVTLSANF